MLVYISPGIKIIHYNHLFRIKNLWDLPFDTLLTCNVCVRGESQKLLYSLSTDSCVVRNNEDGKQDLE